MEQNKANKAPVAQEVYRTVDGHNRDFVGELRDAVAPSADFIETGRPILKKVAESVAASVVDPELRRAIALYAGAQEIDFFGSGETVVPDGFILVRTGEYVELRPDPTIPYMNKDVAVLLRNEFDRQGTGVLESDLSARLGRRETLPILRDAWQQSSVYALFEAFEQDSPDDRSAPLSPYWRRVREAQIEHDIRRRHAMQSQEMFLHGTRARHELVRALHHLDDEVLPREQPVAREQSALERARQYLTPLFDEEFRKGSYSSYSSLEEVRRGVENPDECMDIIWDRTLDVAERILEDNPVAQSPLKRFITWQLDDLVRRVMDPERKTLRSAMDGTLSDDAIECNHEGLIDDWFDIEHDFTSDRIISEESYEELEQKNRAMYDARAVFSREAQLTDRATYEREQARTVAWQVRGRVAGAMRLVMNGPPPLAELPVVTDEELVIEMSGGVATWPTIPGYTLVSKSHYNQYGFVANPEADPYAPCTIPIPSDARQSLAEMYQRIGLERLSFQVAMDERLTVSGLVDVLRASSRYTFSDDKSWRYFPPVTINNLESVSELVRDSMLELQCTGAAQVLKCSLEHVFGVGVSSILAGYTAHPYSTRINGLGHAQTVFTHNNTYYILDATPGYQANGDRSEAPLDGAGQLAAPEIPPPAPMMGADQLVDNRIEGESQLVEVEDPRMMDRSTEVEKLISTATEYLKVSFAVRSDQQLYKHLVGLAPHDPVRKTFELLVRSRRSDTLTDDVDEGARYLSNILQASPSKRATIGVEKYDDVLLSRLEQLLIDMSRINNVGENTQKL